MGSFSLPRSFPFGVHSAGVIPVPIPNTEVKTSSGDYTALRETSKTPIYEKALRKGCFFIKKPAKYDAGFINPYKPKLQEKSSSFSDC